MGLFPNFEKKRKFKIKNKVMEGGDDNWVLLDLSNFVINIFDDENKRKDIEEHFNKISSMMKNEKNIIYLKEN